MKENGFLLFCALPSIALLATVSSFGQSSLCAPVSNNRLVIENLCTPYSESKIVPAVATTTAPALLMLTAEEFSGIKLDDPPTILPGDELVFEANRRDFVLHTQLSNGQEIVTGPLSRADANDTSVAWRKGRVRLDYPDVIGQKIVKYRVRALHETGTSLLFRGIKIYRQGRMMLELEKAVPTPRQKPLAPPFEPPSHYPADAVLVASLNRPGLSLGPPLPPPSGFRRSTLPPMHPAMVQTTTATASIDLNHFKWNGKELDAESGLYNFGARYYSPGLGRFTSPDPKMVTKQKMFDPQQWNMYSFARNNPTTFTDPNGQEVRLAGGLSRSDQNRIIHNLAAAYRKEAGRTAIHGLAKSDITYRYGTGHLPDRTVISNGGVHLEQKFGETVPYLKGTKDQATGQFVSVERNESHVEVTFDFGKLDAASSAFLNGQRQPPPTEEHINDHELGHQVDVDKDPLKERSQSTEQAEKNAEDFANGLAKEKNTMSQKDAEKQVKELLKDPK